MAYHRETVEAVAKADRAGNIIRNINYCFESKDAYE